MQVYRINIPFVSTIWKRSFRVGICIHSLHDLPFLFSSLPIPFRGRFLLFEKVCAVTYKVTAYTIEKQKLKTSMEYLRRKLCLLAGSILLTCAAWGQTLPTDSITKDPEAWYIHFKTGKSNLDLDYNGNRGTLQRCID